MIIFRRVGICISMLCYVYDVCNNDWSSNQIRIKLIWNARDLHTKKNTNKMNDVAISNEMFYQRPFFTEMRAIF